MSQKHPKAIQRKGRVRQYWKKLMDSTHVKMTQGAQFIERIISRSRGDNWRRGREKKK